MKFKIGDEVVILATYPKTLGTIVDYAPVTKLYLVESGHFIETVNEDRLVLQDGLKVGDKVIANENWCGSDYNNFYGTVVEVFEDWIKFKTDHWMLYAVPTKWVSKSTTISKDEYESMKSTLEVLSDPELMEQIRESHEDMKAGRCRGIRGWRL